MDEATERALVDRLRTGDDGAFDVIHETFNGRLFTFLVRLSRRRDVAEDLLEETWLRLVRASARLTPDTRLGPWLFTVARNLYVSYVRSRVLEESAAANPLALWPTAVPEASPFEATAASELGRRLERALASLPSTSREVLLLAATADLPATDAAAICGIAPEAFRQRLCRARRQLSRALDQCGAVPAAAISEVLP